MCVGRGNLTWILNLLFLSGALCNEWKVEYPESRICAVKGSSVVIQCLFYYPKNLKVDRVLWGHKMSNAISGPFIFDSKSVKTFSRFQYIGDKKLNCSLNIHHVEHNDAGKYAFRFVTNEESGKYTGLDGSTLKVVDFKILVTRSNGKNTTKDGDSVNLTCINGCDGDHLSSAFSWFKNGELIKEGPVLNLSNVSSTKSGNYTCSLKTHTETTSEEINIDVEYGPKNTSVSVRPSMEVDAGSNITLMCSSHANPPVKNYTWFKMDENENIMDVGHQLVLISGEGGQFLCRATNKHGSQNSSIVTVKIKQHLTEASFNRAVFIIPTVAVLLIVTAVIVVWRVKKKRASAADCEEDNQDTVEIYINLPVLVNQSQEENKCEEATGLIYSTVDFHTRRMSNIEQEIHSNNDDGDVSYSTVCRCIRKDKGSIRQTYSTKNPSAPALSLSPKMS